MQLLGEIGLLNGFAVYFTSALDDSVESENSAAQLSLAVVDRHL